MASSSAHDFFFQEANTLHFVHSINIQGVMSLGRHTRPACHPGSIRDVLIKKWMLTSIECVFLDFWDARGLGPFSWFAHAQ